MSNLAMAKAISKVQLAGQYSDRHFDEIRLPSGSTHYQVKGEGPVVILVHGVSGPLAVWDNTFEALVASGYRVVRYDLFGRGFSDRLLDSSYSLATYVKQLEELISALKLGPRVRLVGSSLGGIITTEFTLQHPDKVDGLVLIGPAGFPIKTPFAARLRDLPVVGDFLTDLLSYKTILKQNDHYFVNGKMPYELQPYIAAQLLVRGTTNAILKTMKNAPVQSFVESYEALGKLSVPVGVIWGRQDDTFPYENARILMNAAPQAQLVTVENAGHLPQYERADEVNTALVRFERMFDANSSKSMTQ
ncbi:MAG: alpha/beta hydrolase, partial [Bdellovibrionales bacterium]|nr:alpha/beta hydrolase [Bdellovibrionales bacterium]